MSKRELKKSELKISKNAQKAGVLLKDLEKLCEKYTHLYKELSDEEKILLGGVVVGVHSPFIFVSFNSTVGPGVVIDGLHERFKREDGKNPLGTIIEAMGNTLPDPPKLEDVMKKEKKKLIN